MNTILTASQTKVVEFPYAPNGTLKVVAGPGSGKTLTLLHKVHRLITSGQVKADEIVILSLTNKAVDSVIARLYGIFEDLNEEHSEDDLKDIVSRIGVHTIHGLANRVVSENEGLISVIEENGWRGLMKLVSDDFWKNKRSKAPNTREFKKLFEEYTHGGDNKSEVMSKVANIMRNCGVVTNDELIVRAAQYLQKDYQSALAPEDTRLTNDLKKKCKIVLIDEFQDLYPSLLPFLRELSEGKQLILFGDSNQSIYGFLGKNKEVMKGLEKLQNGNNLKVMHLQDNFRCSPEITLAAGKVIRGNREIKNKSEEEINLKQPSGIEPIINEVSDPIDELEFLTDQICQLVCSSARLGDIAVLVRTNAQMEIIADHLKAYGIKSYKLTAQPDWLTDVRIQFLIDLLRAATLSYREELKLRNESTPQVEPWKTDFSIIVTLSALRGVGNQSIQTLYNDCRRLGLSLWNYISTVSKSSWPSAVTNKKRIEIYAKEMKDLAEDRRLITMEDPMSLLKEICNLAHRLGAQVVQPRSNNEADQFKEHLEEMLKVMKLCSQNKPDNISLGEWFLQTYFEQSMVRHHGPSGTKLGSDAVILSTIHSSKGLEFPIVFLMGGFNPFYSFNQIEENVLYVGMTRARNLLYLNNIRHPRISSNSTKRDIIGDEKFWKYYNADLNRRADICSTLAWRNYGSMQRRYGLSLPCRRSYTTLCRKMLIKLLK